MFFANLIFDPKPKLADGQFSKFSYSDFLVFFSSGFLDRATP